MNNTPPQVFNPAAALDRFDNDFDLLFKLTGVFFGEIETYKEMLEQAFSTGNCIELEKIAHKIRGSAHTIGAEQLADIAERIELQSRSPLADIAQTEGDYQKILLKIEQVKETLTEWLKDPVIDLD
jgi:HPt (histidine-containing phosphotransfer) domain-containing protein